MLAFGKWEENCNRKLHNASTISYFVLFVCLLLFSFMFLFVFGVSVLPFNQKKSSKLKKEWFRQLGSHPRMNQSQNSSSAFRHLPQQVVRTVLETGVGCPFTGLQADCRFQHFLLDTNIKRVPAQPSLQYKQLETKDSIKNWVNQYKCNAF